MGRPRRFPDDLHLPVPGCPDPEVDPTSGYNLRADRQQPGEADGMIYSVVRTGAPTAQRNDGKPDVATANFGDGVSAGTVTVLLNTAM